MKIGLFGYGKMGRAIEALALAKGHQIAWRISQENSGDAVPELLRQADVAIEFTRPEAAFKHIKICLEAGVPVVSGTTGWNDRFPEIAAFCEEKNGAFLWASNFSVGVNLFFAVNRFLTRYMDSRPEYSPSIKEIHHIHKLDAPSGTALTLANDIIAGLSRKTHWELNPGESEIEAIPVVSERTGEVPGVHIIRWESPIDELVLEHRAHSRAGFASGALLAAEWLMGKSGVFGMNDVLGL